MSRSFVHRIYAKSLLAPLVDLCNILGKNENKWGELFQGFAAYRLIYSEPEDKANPLFIFVNLIPASSYASCTDMTWYSYFYYYFGTATGKSKGN